MNATDMIMGYDAAEPAVGPFVGGLSCVQIYDQALNEGEVHMKSKCPDADYETYKAKPCPEGYTYFKPHDSCIQV